MIYQSESVLAKVTNFWLHIVLLSEGWFVEQKMLTIQPKYKVFACFIMGFKPTTLSHADIDGNGICAVIRSKIYLNACCV